MSGLTRVLVFQPLFPAGAPLDYRLLGFAFWLADQFTAVGFEGASALFRAPGAGPRQLLASTPPTDDEVRRSMLDNEAKLGVLTYFVVLGGQPHLELARLVRAHRGQPLRNLQRWRYTESVAHLPSAAHELMVAMMSRLGLSVRPSTWQGLFDTADPVLASNYFTALGCHSACEQGFAVDGPELALQAALSGAVAGMRTAIQLVPLLASSLRSSGSASEATLAAAIHEAVATIGAVPPSWAELLAEFAVATPRGLN